MESKYAYPSIMFWIMAIYLQNDVGPELLWWYAVVSMVYYALSLLYMTIKDLVVLIWQKVKSPR